MILIGGRAQQGNFLPRKASHVIISAYLHVQLQPRPTSCIEYRCCRCIHRADRDRDATYARLGRNLPASFLRLPSVSDSGLQRYPDQRARTRANLAGSGRPGAKRTDGLAQLRGEETGGCVSMAREAACCL
jgi:hypothetical protein